MLGGGSVMKNISGMFAAVAKWHKNCCVQAWWSLQVLSE